MIANLPNLTAEREVFEQYLAEALGANRGVLKEAHLLSGGAIQENWKIELDLDGGRFDGRHQFVLRRDAGSCVQVSHGRAQEFALMKAAFNAGVTLPEPLLVCEDPAVLGRPFLLMPFLEGIALGPRVVKDRTLGGNRERLGERLGRELARIHSITPPREDLSFLVPPRDLPALEAITTYRNYLDQLDACRPAIEWGLAWCVKHSPANPSDIVLLHQDFRTGNYLVDDQGLVGILDWEFCGWGDPMSDLGWFCAKCWRFSRPDLEAGGIASRRAFYDGYESESGRKVDDEAVRYWEIMAHIRWAIIALQQGARSEPGGENALELALTGRIAAELELEILRATPPPGGMGL